MRLSSLEQMIKADNRELAWDSNRMLATQRQVKDEEQTEQDHRRRMEQHEKRASIMCSTRSFSDAPMHGNLQSNALSPSSSFTSLGIPSCRHSLSIAVPNSHHDRRHSTPRTNSPGKIEVAAPSSSASPRSSRSSEVTSLLAPQSPCGRQTTALLGTARASVHGLGLKSPETKLKPASTLPSSSPAEGSLSEHSSSSPHHRICPTSPLNLPRACLKLLETPRAGEPKSGYQTSRSATPIRIGISNRDR